MELMQVKYFQAIAAEKSFNKAAKKLFVSQPALSKSMARLEAELGIELFTRQGRHLRLNAFGELFLAQMNTAMLQLADGVRSVRELAGYEYGKVSIAVCERVGLEGLLEEFLCDYPDVHLQEKYYPNNEVQNKLLEGICDFAVVAEPIINPSITWLPLFEDSLCILMSKEHPLAGREKIYVEELSGERIVHGDRSFDDHSYVRDICNRGGFEPHIIYEGGNPDFVGRLVSRGLAVSFAPRSITLGLNKYMPSGYESISKNVVAVPLADELPSKVIGIASAFGHYQSKAALNLYERIVEFYRELGREETA